MAFVFSLRSRQRSAAQTRNRVVLTGNPTSLNSDADCGSRDRLRHFRLQSPAEVDGVGPARYGCQLYRSFVADCDVCRPHHAAADVAADGSATPPCTGSDFRSGGRPKAAVDGGGCDVIKTVTSSTSAGNGVAAAPAQNRAVECPECLAESGRTLNSSPDRYNNVGPLATASRLPCSTVTV